jgi:hypothetical protein
MEKRKFFEKMKSDANVTLSKVFNKVEKVSKISSIKLKIVSLDGKIKNKKTNIGNYVFTNENKFSDFPEIIKIISEIKDYKKQIIEFKDHITKIQNEESSK